MARKRELVGEVARVAGMTFSTVEQHYRHLYSLDLITKKGHGRGAAVMTRRDATRLLLAVAVSPSPLIGAPLVGYYESLIPHAPFQDRMESRNLLPDAPLHAALEAFAMQSPTDRSEGHFLLRASQATASIWATVPGSDTFGPEEIPLVPHADFLDETVAAMVGTDFTRQTRISLGLLHGLYRFVDAEAMQACAA